MLIERTKFYLWRSALTFAVVWLVVGGMHVQAWDDSRWIGASNDTPQVIITKANLEGEKDKLVDELMKAENPKGNPAEFCYLDDNKSGTLPKKDKPSCGVMAMKLSTVQQFQWECTKERLTDAEAQILALTKDRAKKLAKCAIFEHDHLGRWTAATQEMFLTVKVIKSLEN